MNRIYGLHKYMNINPVFYNKSKDFRVDL